MEPEGSLPHSQVPATCPLSWASSIQSIPPYLTYWRSIFILSYHLRLSSKWSLSLRFPTITLYTPLLTPIPATWTSLVTKNRNLINPNHRDIPLGAFVRSIEQVSEFEYFLVFLCLQTMAEALRRHTPCKTLYTVFTSNLVSAKVTDTNKCTCQLTHRAVTVSNTVCWPIKYVQMYYVKNPYVAVNLITNKF